MPYVQLLPAATSATRAATTAASAAHAAFSDHSASTSIFDYQTDADPSFFFPLFRQPHERFFVSIARAD